VYAKTVASLGHFNRPIDSQPGMLACLYATDGDDKALRHSRERDMRDILRTAQPVRRCHHG
jgi:hypothetical protein